MSNEVESCLVIISTQGSSVDSMERKREGVREREQEREREKERERGGGERGR